MMASVCAQQYFTVCLHHAGFSKDNYFCVFWLRNVFTDHKSIVTKHNINKFCLPHTKGLSRCMCPFFILLRIPFSRLSLILYFIVK